MDNQENNNMTADFSEALANAAINMEAPKPQMEAPNKEATSEEPTSEVGIISAGTKVVGDIISKGHLEIEGIVHGNINVLGDVSITGEVKGEIAGNNIFVKAGIVKADINAKGDVCVVASAAIEGNVKGKKIEVEGRIEGNIDAYASLQLDAQAVIHGDITTAALAVGLGAEIQGNIKTTKR